MRKIYLAGALALAVAGTVPAVASADTRCVNPQTNGTTGALVGAAGGAAVGSVLAGRHSRGEGAVLGALGGALLGGAIGHNQVRCPDGYYAYDDQSRQYYDNSGAVYAPQGPGAYGPPPGPGYGPPPGAYNNAPPPPGGGYDYYRGAQEGIRGRMDFAQQRIDRDARSGRLSRREADRAYADLADIRRQNDSMRSRGGGRLNPTDRQYLEDRLNRLAQNTRWDARDGNRY